MNLLRNILKLWPSAVAVFGTVAAIAAFLQPGPAGLIFSIALTTAYLFARITLQHYSQTKWERRGREMFDGLSTPAYLEWQQEILETLYSGLEIAEVYGRKYPAAILRPDRQWQYPFTDLCRLAEVKLPEIAINKEQRTYVKMLGHSLKWPQMRGFALSRILVDDVGRAGIIEAVTSNFLQNVVTTQFLEWELHRLYQRHHLESKTWDSVALLKHLPRRALYHNGRPGRLAVLAPFSAYPLIGLQAIVVYQDTRILSNPTWRIITAKRSNDVVCRPGFFSVPAGGRVRGLWRRN